jgi:hypothetical protein
LLESGRAFGYALNQPGISAETLVGAQISAGISNRENGKKKGFLSLIVNQDSKPHFEFVEAVFGEEWKIEMRSPPLHGPPPPRTSPHANETVDFLFDGMVIRRGATFTFFGNGSISNLGLYEEI